MIEFIVSIFVAAIIVLIYRRYKTVFCLPFFWAALFACIYLGLLQIRAESGGSSYLYAAVGFGTYFVGLLAVDILIFFRSGLARFKNRRPRASGDFRKPDSREAVQSRPTRIRLLFPSLPLKVGLFVSLVGATFVSFILFCQNGVPIFSSFPAMAWIQATSGIVNRLMTVFGPGCFASLGLMAWAVHRETGSRAARALMYLGLGLAILCNALLASKAAAIMVFIWFNIMLFYINKKRKFWESLMPFVIVVVPLSAAIVAVRSMSSYGYWQAEGIYQTFAARLTTGPAEPVDFIFKYMNRFGTMHGGAMHREVARIRDQLTGRYKTPLLSEFVYDLLTGESTNTTGLSASLTPLGTGYVEWGMAGMLMYSFLQGLAFGWVHRHLLHREKMNILALMFWGANVSYLLAVSSSGTILVSFESVYLGIIPPLLLLLPFSFVFLLPLAKRYGTSVHGRVSGFPKGERRWLRN